jgi:hypothetical protein
MVNGEELIEVAAGIGDVLERDEGGLRKEEVVAERRLVLDDGVEQMSGTFLQIGARQRRPALVQRVLRRLFAGRAGGHVVDRRGAGARARVDDR